MSNFRTQWKHRGVFAGSLCSLLCSLWHLLLCTFAGRVGRLGSVISRPLRIQTVRVSLITCSGFSCYTHPIKLEWAVFISALHSRLGQDGGTDTQPSHCADLYIPSMERSTWHKEKLGVWARCCLWVYLILTATMQGSLHCAHVTNASWRDYTTCLRSHSF